jgi:hypothetical protein
MGRWRGLSRANAQGSTPSSSPTAPAAALWAHGESLAARRRVFSYKPWWQKRRRRRRQRRTLPASQATSARRPAHRTPSSAGSRTRARRVRRVRRRSGAPGSIGRGGAGGRWGGARAQGRWREDELPAQCSCWCRGPLSTCCSCRTWTPPNRTQPSASDPPRSSYHLSFLPKQGTDLFSGTYHHYQSHTLLDF